MFDYITLPKQIEIEGTTYCPFTHERDIILSSDGDQDLLLERGCDILVEYAKEDGAKSQFQIEQRLDAEFTAWCIREEFKNFIIIVD